ncbi:DUF4436 domain-containing protein [Nocardia altamirensis]|uniref:DUF4436 domain-containing protein n=1 Tax=Nocardia altamirensis TaxID=472158 RepID=UPI001C3F6F6C|nr:DUF4436 domain-containing protein [Nocardia altamirensis]
MTRFRKTFAALAAVLVVAVAIVVSLTLYQLQKDHVQTVHLIGHLDDADRVDLDVVVIQIDAALQEMSVQVTPMPRGALADELGRFRADTTIDLYGVKPEPILAKAGETISASEVRIAMGGGGMITDYPFDKYRVNIDAAAASGDRPVPMVISLYSLDAFFKILPKIDDEQRGDAIGTVVTVSRSTASLTFALFVMVLMLGLALAAGTAAFYVLSGKRGLIWPANTLMAAVLFAMIPLRNAVPGSPPIGSVIDFGSFFIAETVVALSLICTVLVGYRHEVGNERKDAVQ